MVNVDRTYQAIPSNILLCTTCFSLLYHLISFRLNSICESYDEHKIGEYCKVVEFSSWTRRETQDCKHVLRILCMWVCSRAFIIVNVCTMVEIKFHILALNLLSVDRAHWLEGTYSNVDSIMDEMPKRPTIFALENYKRTTLFNAQHNQRTTIFFFSHHFATILSNSCI